MNANGMRHCAAASRQCIFDFASTWSLHDPSKMVGHYPIILGSWTYCLFGSEGDSRQMQHLHPFALRPPRPASRRPPQRFRTDQCVDTGNTLASACQEIMYKHMRKPSTWVLLPAHQDSSTYSAMCAQTLNAPSNAPRRF